MFQNDEPPEITYCVVGGEGGLALQAVTPTHPMPPAHELDAKFAELVVSTQIYPCISVVISESSRSPHEISYDKNDFGTNRDLISFFQFRM